LLFAEFILGLAEGETRGLAMTQVWLPTNPTNSGPAMPTYTALVTLLAVALYFFIATRVAAARVKFGVKLPATSGHPDFERVFRVHQNMLEWTPTFLVPLWLCAIYLSDIGAAVLGLVWVVGRIVYFVGYRQAVEKRLPGFLIQSTVCLLLFIGAAVGVVMRLAGG
jgi:glutathione S-transferase